MVKRPIKGEIVVLLGLPLVHIGRREF